MLEIINLGKFYKHKEYTVNAVQNLNLTIKDREFIPEFTPSFIQQVSCF